NLPGINFVPSVFNSRLSPAGALILLIPLPFLSLLVWRSSFFKGTFARTFWAAFVLAVPLILYGSLLGRPGRDERWPSRVVVPPLTVTTSPPLSAGLLSADGSLGKVEAGGSGLKATHLTRAGAYEGFLKIGQGVEAKEVKVVANVSDWWPYAFLTIALGVMLGYYLTRYFKQQRGEAEQGARAAQLWLRVSDEESRFQLPHGGTPYAGYSVAAAARDWLERGRRLLGAHDAAAAKSSLDRLEAYLNSFAQFREQTVALDELRAGVLEQIERDPPSPKPDMSVVRVFRDAEDALNGRPLTYTGDEEQQGTELKSLSARAQVVNDWLRTLGKTLEAIGKYTEEAEALHADQETLDKFEAAKLAAILADKKEGVVAAEGAAASAYAALLSKAEVHAEKAGGAHAAFMAHARPEVTAVSLTHETATIEGAGLDTDDLHVFSADIATRKGARPPRLRWDFGDGSTTEVPPSALKPGETTTLRVSHRYAEGGAYTVALEKSSGETLDDLKVTVAKGPGRAERRLALFRLTDWQMSVLAGLVTVGFGFYTLYMSKSVWGTPGDYLNCILWGSVVSEGLKYVVNLVDRVWAK
ncbi:MAG TPA: PKD domain-containing protein, partial [Pyrinomonadaceae bacterium]